MTSIYADLHIHSIYSDGIKTPDEIIHIAEKNRLHYISITDHDTMEAYRHLSSDSALVDIIPGVEYSCIYDNQEIHVLGYFKKVFSEESSFSERAEDRYNRALAMLECINSKGFNFTHDDLIQEAGSSMVLGRPHLARLLLKNGIVSTFEEAFRKFIGNNSPCYKRKKEYGLSETIEMIHDRNGLAVIAHPETSQITHIVDRFIQLGIDGIEVFNSIRNRDKEYLTNICLENGLLITGGSDYHGSDEYNKRGLLKQYADKFLEKWREL